MNTTLLIIALIILVACGSYAIYLFIKNLQDAPLDWLRKKK